MGYKTGGEAKAQHKRLAEGQDIMSKSSKVQRYAQGGTVAQMAGRPEPMIDHTSFQRYGNGFRRVRGR